MIVKRNENPRFLINGENTESNVNSLVEIMKDYSARSFCHLPGTKAYEEGIKNYKKDMVPEIKTLKKELYNYFDSPVKHNSIKEIADEVLLAKEVFNTYDKNIAEYSLKHFSFLPQYLLSKVNFKIDKIGKDKYVLEFFNNFDKEKINRVTKKNLDKNNINYDFSISINPKEEEYDEVINSVNNLITINLPNSLQLENILKEEFKNSGETSIVRTFSPNISINYLFNSNKIILSSIMNEEFIVDFGKNPRVEVYFKTNTHNVNHFKEYEEQMKLVKNLYILLND